MGMIVLLPHNHALIPTEQSRINQLDAQILGIIALITDIRSIVMQADPDFFDLLPPAFAQYYNALDTFILGREEAQLFGSLAHIHQLFLSIHADLTAALLSRRLNRVESSLKSYAANFPSLTTFFSLPDLILNGRTHTQMTPTQIQIHTLIIVNTLLVFVALCFFCVGGRCGCRQEFQTSGCCSLWGWLPCAWLPALCSSSCCCPYSTVPATD